MSTGDSYLYVDVKEQGIGGFRFENSNEDLKQRKSWEHPHFLRRARGTSLYSGRWLVKILQGGERFDRIVFHYPLGEVPLQLPEWNNNSENCEVEFNEYTVFTELPLRVVASGVDYKLDFHPVISGAVIKSARLVQLSEKQASGYQSLEALKASLGEKQVLIGKLPFNYQGFADRTQNDLTDKTVSDLFRFKFFKEWTATVKAGVPSQVAFTIPEEGNYLLLVENDNGQLYAFNFTPRVADAHAVVKNDKEAMTLTIVHDWLLTGQGLSGQLDRILGSGNYTLEVSSLKEA